MCEKTVITKYKGNTNSIQSKQDNPKSATNGSTIVTDLCSIPCILAANMLGVPCLSVCMCCQSILPHTIYIFIFTFSINSIQYVPNLN